MFAFSRTFTYIAEYALQLLTDLKSRLRIREADQTPLDLDQQRHVLEIKLRPPIQQEVQPFGALIHLLEDKVACCTLADEKPIEVNDVRVIPDLTNLLSV